MNRKAILCAALAMMMILSGTLYAAWTDNLKVTTTATTGDLQVKFIDFGVYAQYTNEQVGNPGWSIIDGIKEGFVESNAFMRGTSNFNIIATQAQIDAYNARSKGYHKVDFVTGTGLVTPTKLKEAIDVYGTNTDSSSEIKINVKNIYPGYAQTFRTDIVNVGSIAASLGDITFDVKGVNGNLASDELKGLLGIALLVDREYYTGGEHGDKVWGLAESTGIDADDIFTLGGVDFVRLSALSKVDFEDPTNQELLALPSNNRMDLYLGIAMDPDLDGKYTSGTTANLSNKSDKKSQNTGATIVVDLLWDQFNVAKNTTDPNTTNILEEQNH